MQVRSKTARVALATSSHGWLSRAVAETTEFDSEFVAGTFEGDIEGRICFI
jgi:phosphoserine phosphatase